MEIAETVPIINPKSNPDTISSPGFTIFPVHDTIDKYPVLV